MFVVIRPDDEFPCRTMSKNENSSSSSDDESLTSAYKEACDEEFLPQSLFEPKNPSLAVLEAKPNDKAIKPSLRVTERADNFENFGVSQNFKNHVANKLDDLLNRSIIDDDSNQSEEHIPKKKKKKRRIKKDCGIKLLSSSTKILTEVETVQIQPQQMRVLKPWKFTAENEAENMTKCQEVAVDGNWVLTKSGTQGWNERCKGAVFKYKIASNGVLIEDQ